MKKTIVKIGQNHPTLKAGDKNKPLELGIQFAGLQNITATSGAIAVTLVGIDDSDVEYPFSSIALQLDRPIATALFNAIQQGEFSQVFGEIIAAALTAKKFDPLIAKLTPAQAE